MHRFIYIYCTRFPSGDRGTEVPQPDTHTLCWSLSSFVKTARARLAAKFRALRAEERSFSTWSTVRYCLALLDELLNTSKVTLWVWWEDIPIGSAIGITSLVLLRVRWFQFCWECPDSGVRGQHSLMTHMNYRVTEFESVPLWMRAPSSELATFPWMQ